jgi:hypothetical protein
LTRKKKKKKKKLSTLATHLLIGAFFCYFVIFPAFDTTRRVNSVLARVDAVRRAAGWADELPPSGAQSKFLILHFDFRFSRVSNIISAFGLLRLQRSADRV